MTAWPTAPTSRSSEVVDAAVELLAASFRRGAQLRRPVPDPTVRARALPHVFTGLWRYAFRHGSLADQQGLSCYLEAQRPATVAWYERHGFTVRTTARVLPGGPLQLVRAAAPKDAMTDP